MRDMDALEESAVEWWKDRWKGIESYERLLTYATFASVGFGMGGLFVIRKLILENPQYLTEALSNDTQVVTKLVVGIAVTGIVVSQLLLSALHYRFPSD